MKNKLVYNRPEIETIEMELTDTIMSVSGSGVAFSEEKYDGAANSRKRGIWGSDE